MTTKEYLRQIKQLDNRIDNRLKELCQFSELAYKITAASPDSERVQSTPHDKMAMAVARIVDMQKEINALVDEYVDKKAALVLQIESLPDRAQYDILYKRYVLYMSWDDISYETKYTKRNVLFIHGKALLEFEEMYGEKYLDG